MPITSVELGTGCSGPKWTAPVPRMRMYPLAYEEFLDEKLRRLRLTGAMRNVLLRVAREAGRRDFDVLLALTGYAADRYSFLRSLPAALAADTAARESTPRTNGANAAA